MAAEKAWLKAFTSGSKSLQDRLRKVHANNPEFQSFLGKQGLESGSSVKQASKSQAVSKEVAAKRAELSNKAYGATTGAKMGGEHGSSDEYKDTTVPLTKDQHSRVQAAKKAALTKDERMAAIARASRKSKTGERYEVPTEDPDDAGHEDLRDLHHSLHIGHGSSLDEASPYAWYSKEAQDQESQKTVHLAAKHMMRTLRKLPADSAERKGIAKALQGVVGAIKEDVLDEDLSEKTIKQIKKDIDSGMSRDAVIGKHANKNLTNTDQIRKVIQRHSWDKQMKKEDVLDEAKSRRDLESFLHKDELPHSHVKAIIKKGKWTPSEGVKPKPGEHITLYNRDHLGRATTSHRLYVYPDADEHKGKVKIGPIEEAEQIDELKKSTIANYVDKSLDKGKENRLEPWQRKEGLKNAVSKLTKGDDSITSRYLKQATNDAAFRIMHKAGIRAAAKKLAKEEVEQVKEDLDQKFPDEGTTVKVVGKVQHAGKKGKVVSSNKDGTFHVVNIKGKNHSFHGSDLVLAKEEVELEEGDLTIRTLYNKFADAEANGRDTKPAEKAIKKVHGDVVLKHMKKASKANSKADFDGEEKHFYKAQAAGEKTDIIGGTVGRGRSKFMRKMREWSEEVTLEEDNKHPAEDQVASALKQGYGDALYHSKVTGGKHHIKSYAPNEFRSGMMKSKTLSGLLHTIDKKVNNKTPATGTLRFREHVEQVDEAIRGFIGKSDSPAVRRPADQTERDKLAADLSANRGYNKGKKSGRDSGNVRKNAAGMTPDQRTTYALYDKSGRSNKQSGPKQFPYSEEVEQIDEISSKLAGEYLAKATKQHMDKVGVRPDMYGRIEKDMGKKRKDGVSRALDRILGDGKTNEESTPMENNSYLNNKLNSIRESLITKIANRWGKIK